MGLCVPALASADPLVVDGSSVGGVCSDARPPVAVTLATPWCTIAQAVKAAPSGSTVYVRGGSYPHQDLNGLGSRTGYVTFEPLGYIFGAPEQVTIAGISTQNTSFLRFRGFHLTGNDSSGFGPAARIYTYSQNIQFIDNELTGQGIFLQTAAHVLLQGNYIHNVTRNCNVTNVGDGGGIFLIGANSGSLLSQDIQVLDNRIEGTLQDSLNVGSIANLVVRGNDMSTGKPQCGDHTDLVQIEGGTYGPITITNNTFHDGGQFILRNATGLTIANNLILRVNQWMQLMADPGARIINNTWYGGNAACTGCGSLIIRDYTSTDTWAQPPFNYKNHMRGTVIENNIMRMFANTAVPKADYHEDYDLIANKPNSTGVQGSHTIFGTPTFANPAGGDFHLAGTSLGIDSADSTVAPQTDLLGQGRYDDPAVKNSGAGPTPFVDRGALELQAPPQAAPAPNVTAAPAPVTLNVAAGFVRKAAKRGIFGLRATCSGTCRLTVRGRLEFFRRSGGKHPKRKRAAAFRIRSATVTLADGRVRTIHLRLRGVSKRRLHAAVRRYGRKPVLVLLVKAQGPDGGVTTKPLRLHPRL